MSTIALYGFAVVTIAKAILSLALPILPAVEMAEAA